MKILVLDTETTDKVNFRLSIADQSAHLVQVAAMLIGDDRNSVAEFKSLIKPDGWTIGAEAEAVHRISINDCNRFGVPIPTAMMTLNSLANQADLIVAHNVQFDDLVLSCEAARLPYSMSFAYSVERYCTMRAATPICKLPGKFGDFKWPKLAEAYRILCGGEFDWAHDAMNDVRACAKVYFAIRDLENAKL